MASTGKGPWFSLIFPSGLPDRVRLIVQFVEKRMVRETPKGIRNQLNLIFLGAGTNWWAR